MDLLKKLDELDERYKEVSKLVQDPDLVKDLFKKVILTVTCETHGNDHIEQITKALTKNGFSIERVY